MILFNINSIVAGTLLIFSAAFIGANFLGVLDGIAGLFLLWTSIHRIDPPGGGDHRFKLPAYGA